MEDQRILMEIADDGCGLPPANEMRPGNGLHNMKTRATEVGGTCEFLKHESGTGTIIRLKVPVRP